MIRIQDEFHPHGRVGSTLHASCGLSDLKYYPIAPRAITFNFNNWLTYRRTMDLNYHYASRSSLDTRMQLHHRVGKGRPILWEIQSVLGSFDCRVRPEELVKGLIYCPEICFSLRLRWIRL